MRLNPKAPKFWFQKGHPLSFLLAPAGGLYGLAVRLRFALTKPCRSKRPVICIGNFTVGGGGKTPLALALAEQLANKGYQPVFLTRGYGGQISGPHLVDPLSDNAQMVGDEPLLLAKVAPVVVSADRPAGARLIEGMEADIILMDDGFQNPTLYKDLSIVVVDEAQGIGNERVFPAGPLRAPMAFQLARTDLLVIAGPASQSATVRIEQGFKREIFRSDLLAKGQVDWLQGARVMAVTGIARPDKFYASLQRLGAELVQRHDFPDHYMFSEQDAQNLLSLSKTDEAQIIMTRKDWVRLPETGQLGELRAKARVLDVTAKIDRPAELLALIEKTISAAR
ncbi:MAG: tetraacyldisaccharide 4'-kinase [Hyphomicrobiaceae bacterium]|nr:tetraacyldisaccharide 4'-kinase [Hyphomicrobiaceae bacterium]